MIKVTDKEISTKEMKNGEISSMPYGMTVWSTGIGTRPIIKDFMTQIGQVSLLKIFAITILQVYLTNNSVFSLINLLNQILSLLHHLSHL